MYAFFYSGAACVHGRLCGVYCRNGVARNERAISFLKRDMRHEHKVESMTRAQKTFKPLNAQRVNHSLTSSSNAGSNFLRRTIGGSTGRQIPVVALTPLHSFEDMPPGTVQLGKK